MDATVVDQEVKLKLWLNFWEFHTQQGNWELSLDRGHWSTSFPVHIRAWLHPALWNILIFVLALSTAPIDRFFTNQFLNSPDTLKVGISYQLIGEHRKPIILELSPRMVLLLQWQKTGTHLRAGVWLQTSSTVDRSMKALSPFPRAIK